MTLEIGNFGYVCSNAPLLICSVLDLTGPKCYSRNMDLSGFLLFQPAVLVVDIVSLFITALIIHSIKRKYTAVGRREMLIFFHGFSLYLLMEFLLISNIVSYGSVVSTYITAAYVAVISTTFWILMLNGFVGFQWTEDGSKLSMWCFKVSSSVVFGIVYLVSICTFLKVGFFAKSTDILFAIYYIFNGAAVLIYCILQVILVVSNFEDMWPLGDILCGVIFFLMYQLAISFASTPICRVTVHYIDGMSFGSVFLLMSVMMVYKYWDSITNEDLELSIANIHNPMPLFNSKTS